MTALNNELIDKVMAKIATDPEAWSQATWVCKTTACFAGHALIESGLYEIRVISDRPCPYDDIDCQCGTEVAIVDKETGSVVNVQSRARELLGFNEGEAHRVFLDTSTDLEEMASVIANIRA